FRSAGGLGRIRVPRATSFARGLPLWQGLLLAGSVRNPSGVPVPIPVTIQSGAELDTTSDASGAFQVLVPAGVYTMSASTSATENGLPVVYRAAMSVVVSADTIANVALTKVVSRSATLTWDASQRRTIVAGASVSYAIVARNTGNVAENF